MASLRKEGRYWKIYFRYEGKRYHRSTRTGNRVIAEQIKRKIEDELAAKKFNLRIVDQNNKILLKSFLDEAYQYALVNKAARTAEREKEIFDTFNLFCDNIPVMMIDVKKIEDYKAYLTDRSHKPGGINVHLRTLQAAFSLAVQYNYIASNPFKSVRKVIVSKHKPRFLNRKQANALLEFTSGRNIHQYIMIALYSGARISEVCNLKWRDVDLQHKTIKVIGKGHRERTIPIPNILVNYLTKFIQNTEYVVSGSRNYKEITRQFRKYADDCNLSEFTFHDLRHTYASWLAQNGITIQVIKELLGHSSINTTMIYAHLIPDTKREAVKIFDR